MPERRGHKPFVEQMLWLPDAVSQKHSFLVAKLSWFDTCWNKETVHWSGTQVSRWYAQGVINRLVNEASVSTAAPNRLAVHSSRVDQGNGGCAQYCGTRTPA